MLQVPEQSFPCSLWRSPWESTLEQRSTCSHWRTPCLRDPMGSLCRTYKHTERGACTGADLPAGLVTPFWFYLSLANSDLFGNKLNSFSSSWACFDHDSCWWLIFACLPLFLLTSPYLHSVSPVELRRGVIEQLGWAPGVQLWPTYHTMSCVCQLNKHFCHATYALLRKREEDNTRTMFTVYSTAECLLSAW